MKKTLSPAVLLMGGAALLVVGLIGFTVIKGSGPSVNDGFAQCLSEKGVKMYGAWWCPHCSNQKALFGSAFKYINYVECSPNNTKTMSVQCKNDGITGFPTWVFADGSQLGGEQTFAALSAKTGCELPAAE